MMTLARTHLTDELRRDKFRFSALTAAHGFGKSTLLRLFNQREPQSILIHLSDADPTPLSIAGLVRDALISKFGNHPDHRLPFDLDRPNLTAIGAAAAVRHDLALHAPLTVLVDDGDLLEYEGRRFFLQVLSNLHENVRMIFALHADENLPLSSQQPRVNVLFLGNEHLRFSEVEGAEMGLSPDVLTETGGWPAAVMLAKQGMSANIVAEGFLSSLPEALLLDMRRMSLLPTWSEKDTQIHQALALRDGWLSEVRLKGVPLTQVGPGAFQPNPLIRRLLLAALHSRPAELQATQRAVAQAVASSQPLAAAEAFLNAGDTAQAQNLLNSILDNLHSAESIADALPVLERLNPKNDSPLYLALAQGYFEVGRIIDGLRMADESTRTLEGEARAQAFGTLGRMRLRTGNVRAAQQALSQAVTFSQNAAVKRGIRAELALALALSSRAAPQHAEEAQREALYVRQTEPDALSDNMVLAHTAQMLASASKGQRTLALESAEKAVSVISTLSGGYVTTSCLLHISEFLADEGQAEQAAELYQKAEHAYGPLTSADHSPLACQFYLTKARLLLRRGDEHAAVQAALAADVALRFGDMPLYLEAVFLQFSAIFSGHPGLLKERVKSLLRAFQGDAASREALTLAEAIFTQRHTLHVRDLQTVQTMPPELRLLAVLAIIRNHQEEGVRVPNLWHEELGQLRRIVGVGATAMYASKLGVTLPDHLSGTLQLDVQCLTGRPRVIFNGVPLQLEPRFLLILLAIIFTPDHTLKAKDIPSLFDGITPRSYSTNKGELVKLLNDLAGRSNAVTSAYGILSLEGWQISTDLDRLEQCSDAELDGLYRSAVFADLSDPPPFLLAMRDQARRVISRRIRKIQQSRPGALSDFQGLLTRDPGLRRHLNLVDPETVEG